VGSIFFFFYFSNSSSSLRTLLLTFPASSSTEASEESFPVLFVSLIRGDGASLYDGRTMLPLWVTFPCFDVSSVEVMELYLKWVDLDTDFCPTLLLNLLKESLL